MNMIRLGGFPHPTPEKKSDVDRLAEFIEECVKYLDGRLDRLEEKLDRMTSQEPTDDR